MRLGRGRVRDNASRRSRRAQRPSSGTLHAVTRPLDFSLPDHQGGTFRLADALRERTVVVLFYRGDW